MTEEVQKHSVHTLVFRSLKRTHDMFLSEQSSAPGKDDHAEKIWKHCKLIADYGQVKDLPKEGGRKQPHSRDVIRPYGEGNWQESELGVQGSHPYPNAPGVQLTDGTSLHTDPSSVGRELALYDQTRQTGTPSGASVHEIRQNAGFSERMDPTSRAVSIGQQQMLVPRKAPTMPKPQWHPPWKLYRENAYKSPKEDVYSIDLKPLQVISGHLGWVRCIAVEPGNEWFVTGAGDRVIKIWDLATGTLKLSLTGHVSSVRGVAVSPRQPYLFSCGEDKQVKCWDLEYNKVIRHYHGHLSAVHSLDIHPTIDILCSCGRDSTVRVWDMRTKACVHTMVGHQNTVAVVKCQAAEPQENAYKSPKEDVYSIDLKPLQVISGSHDCTVRLWDLAAGRSKVTLTNHKKSVRGLALHPAQYTFASASPDNIKQWKFPDGNFIQNMSGHNAIINALALNSDNILVSAADNGTMHFWDWRTGYNFQRLQAAVQPGSIDSEAGIFAVQFDHSGTRLITAEADKTIKIYKEDESATEESHPINWRPDILKKKRY